MAELFGNVSNLREAQDAINALQKQIALFRGITPSVSPTTGEKRYVIGGVTYTQAGLDKEIKLREKRATDLYNKWVKPVGQEEFAQEKAATQKQVDELFQKLSPRKVELEQQIRALEDADKKVSKASEQDNIRTWLTYYKSALADLNAAINKLRGGELPSVVPPEVKFATVAQSKKSAAPIPFATSNLAPTIPGGRGQGVNIVGQPGGVDRPGMGVAPTTPPASQPFVPGEGQGIFGQPETTGVSETVSSTTSRVPGVSPDRLDTGVVPTPPSPLTAGDMSAVLAGLPAVETPAPTPTPTPTPTPGVTPTPGATPTPTAPSFTDPSTGVTYQPGEMVGGEDRALPNGGAVVNGIYIPPGIDYAWLGQQVPEDWEAAAKELYGAYYEMIKQVPELGNLIRKAIGPPAWSDDKFQYELEQTNWWKTTSANTRNWETLLIQDPASAQVQLDNRTALLRDTAQRLGITLTSESLARIAEDSIKLGLELTSQLEDIVGSEALRSVGTVSQLRYGYVGNSIRESARKYGVALSDTTFNEWVNKIAVGAESTETFESYAQQIARTLYPSLNNGFDRGLSFAQMTDPYAQVASRILEIPGAQVDFTNPKWAQAFTMKDDKGNPMQMSFGEWADYLRTDPSFGWEYTDDAKNRAYTVVNRLAELFGAA